MPKVDRSGQAEIFTETDFRRLISKVKKPSHRILFFLAWFTGERMGAILKLKVENVYEYPKDSITRKEVVFPSSARKKDIHGHAETRSVPMHPDLAYELGRFKPPSSGWLFGGRSPADHLSLRAGDYALRRALAKAKLHRKGYSTHSFRRTFITDLSNKGVGIPDLKAVTGHKSVQSLERYIQTDPARKAQVINLR